MSMVDLAEHRERARPSGRARSRHHRIGRTLRVLAVCVPAALLVGAQPAAAFPQEQSQGSSFAAVAIDQWVGQASALYGFNINFQVSSSVLGLNAFANNNADFVASDIPYSSGQADSTPNQPYQYMPDVAGALAFMYNLQGVNGQPIKNLNLNPQTVGAIFTGKIGFWDDPSIKAVNPPGVALNLPHTPIVPVYREDASGENYLLSDYLLHQDGPAFVAYQNAVADSQPGKPLATWPLSQTSPPSGYPNYTSLTGQNGSDGVANYVSALSSEGSIGYLETAYAIEHNFPVASLINASGNAVQPTSVNDATALENAVLFADLTQDLTNVYANPLPNAYPVSAYSYFVAPCNPSLAAAQKFTCAGPQGTSPFSADRGAELGQFINFLACAGQEKMALLGYSPLPPNLVQEDFNAIGRLNGGQQPPAPTAANCHNPYVDGEVVLPGGSGPTINTSVQDANSVGAQTVTQQQAVTKASQGVTGKGSGPGTTGGSATSTNDGGGNGSTAPGSTHSGTTRSESAANTAALGNPYERFNALEQVATDAKGPSAGLVALWCVILAVILIGPLFGRLLWRRRSRTAENVAVLSGETL
ncbi:MAG TPA: substrate-binding domain-containing protein [Acidimicrobiales bacterium]|nr:substrate-binding domain-containing protein [Acidimicrobiales bacterium]